MNINELELRYGDCTVKKLTGGILSSAMRNLTKFRYAGNPLGAIHVTGRFGCPIGDIMMNGASQRWYFTPDGQDPYNERNSAAELMSDVRAFIASNYVSE